MRLPGLNVYRAFAELDAFSDAQCREYVRLARRRRWPLVRLATLFQAGIAVGGIVLVLVAVIWTQYVLLDVSNGRLPGWVMHAASAAVIVIVGLPAGVLTMVVRDAVLRRAIRSQLLRVDCHRCRYTLLGIPVEDGVIVCPECGFTLELDKYGLTPEDFMAQSRQA